jgi:hypothetical protein
MSRMWWIILLVAAGVGLAVVIGVLGTRNEPSTSKAEEVSSLCASLKTLESSLQTLTGLSSSSSMTQFQADVTAVDTAWDQVKSDAQAVQDAPTGDLDSAWDSFTAAVKDVPNDASVSDAVSDITQSADQLVSAAESTAQQVNCSSPSTTSTTTTTTS